jgi:flagellar hook-basal body complex protein FliE
MIESVKQISSMTKSAGIDSLSSVYETGSNAAAASAATPGMAGGVSFASMLGDLSVSAVNNLKTAEVKSFDAIQGKANSREVVDAMLSAEQSLQTAIALRDKIVNAYLEITKMQI